VAHGVAHGVEAWRCKDASLGNGGTRGSRLEGLFLTCAQFP
jgi:hypothetical protein